MIRPLRLSGQFEYDTGPLAFAVYFRVSGSELLLAERLGVGEGEFKKVLEKHPAIAGFVLMFPT